MTSTPIQFIKIQNQTVYSNCVEYRNDAEKIIHLIPVLHVGEERYYRDLIQYVGNKRCLYEYVKGDYAKMIENVPKGFSINSDYEDFLQVFNQIVFYKVNKTSFEKMLEKDLPDDLKHLLTLTKEYSTLSEKSRIIFKILNETNFSLDTLTVLQRYMSELMELIHQTQAIDYIVEIPNLPNWEHLDLEIQFDLEQLKKPIEFTPEFIQSWSQQMRITLSLYSVCLQFEEEPDINSRRKEFAEQSLSFFTNKTETDEILTQLPEILVGVRDKVIKDFLMSSQYEGNEFAIFYGAAHLYTIESILKSQGFQAKKETPIKVFGF